MKHPKNHLIAIKAFSETALVSQGWTVHLIGKIFHGEYFVSIKFFINEAQLSKAVFFYDSCQDIKNILSQCNIGILVSTSEGFPVVILEYAKVKLAVVSVNVGHCATIIEDGQSGFLFDPNNIDNFKRQLERCATDTHLSQVMANNLHQFCRINFSENAVLSQLLTIYNNKSL